MNVKRNTKIMDQFKMYEDLNFGEMRASWNTAKKGKSFVYECLCNGEVVYRTVTDRVYQAISVVQHNENNWQCLNRFGRLDLVHSRLKDYRQSYMHKITLFTLQGPHPELTTRPGASN